MHLHNMRADWKVYIRPLCTFLAGLLLHRRVISDHTYKEGIVSSYILLGILKYIQISIYQLPYTATIPSVKW